MTLEQQYISKTKQPVLADVLDLIRKELGLAVVSNARTRNPNPLRMDPSRTGLLRKKWEADFSRRFEDLRKRLWKLVVEEDAFGLTVTSNVYCATGEGGGKDPTCSPSGAKSLEVGGTAQIDVAGLLESSRSYSKARRDVVQGRGSKTLGPIDVWETEKGELLVVDGHHRLAEELLRGKRKIAVRLVGKGYTDYWAAPSESDRLDLEEELTDNIYCATGEGGGKDPTCKKGESRGQESSAGQAVPGAGRVAGLPVRADGRVELTHWSGAPGIKQLDPQKAHHGLGGAERQRQDSDPANWVNRTYYGLGVGQPGGYKKEPGLGMHRYQTSIQPGELYNLGADPQDLYPEGYKDGDQTSHWEKLIHEAGYKGYWIKHPSLGLVASVFEPLPVEKEQNDLTVHGLLQVINAPNCGTGAGGFKPGNTCAKGGSLSAIPPEPGTAPVKPGYVRLYHQTTEEGLKSIEKTGLTYEHARGIEGPRSIYATETPFYGTVRDRPTLEFQVPLEDFEPPMFVRRDVKPEDFLGVHYPWHGHARYIESSPEVIAEAVAGSLDHLLDDKSYGPAIRYIKQKYGELATNAGENCGTGAGGFRPGNTCASGGGGLSPGAEQKIRAELTAGKLVYHGTRQRAPGMDFASDPGDMGRGWYGSTNKVTARHYGKLGVYRVALKNPLILPEREVYELADLYQTVRLSEDEIDKIFQRVGRRNTVKSIQQQQLKNSQRLTDDLKAKGYDGVVSVKMGRGYGGLEIVAFDSPSAVTENVLTANAGRWAFLTSSKTLQEFGKWIKVQLLETLLGAAEHPDLQPSDEEEPGESWLVKYIRRAYKKSMEKSYDDIMRPTGVRPFPEEAGAAYQAGGKAEFMRQSFGGPVGIERVKQLASRTFTNLEGIGEDLSKTVGEELLEGMVEGKSPLEVGRKLNKIVGGYKNRGKMIARTETMRAHAEGALDTMQALGAGKVRAMVEWSTSGLGETKRGYPSPCELCSELEGMVLTLEEARGLLPRHPGCLCAWRPANVGEDTKGQLRTKDRLAKAIDQSLRAEMPKSKKRTLAQQRKLSGWLGAGAAKRISKERPKPFLIKRGR